MFDNGQMYAEAFPLGGAWVQSVSIPWLLPPSYELCSFCLCQVWLKLASIQKIEELQKQEHVSLWNNYKNHASVSNQHLC